MAERRLDRGVYELIPSSRGAAQALQNANEISEGIASEFLLSLLEINLPKSGKKNKITLGVADKNLAGAIKGAFPGLECETGETSEIVQEMLRGIRQHSHKLLKQLQEGDVERANLGLGVRLPNCHRRLKNHGLTKSHRNTARLFSSES